MTRAAIKRRNAPPQSPAAKHTGLIKAIRAACKRLNISEDDRKAIVAQRTGKQSLSLCSARELGELLDHFNKDWKPQTGPRPHVGKIRALWWSLYWLGAIHRPDDDALSAFVERQTGIGHLRFLDHRKAPAVIEALKSWLEREGVLWSSDDEIAEVVACGLKYAHYTRAEADRLAVMNRLFAKLKLAKVMHTPELYLRRVLSRPNATTECELTANELDAGLRALGKKYRQHIDAGRLE